MISCSEIIIDANFYFINRNRDEFIFIQISQLTQKMKRDDIKGWTSDKLFMQNFDSVFFFLLLVPFSRQMKYLLLLAVFFTSSKYVPDY
jgi:hypothetical protein